MSDPAPYIDEPPAGGAALETRPSAAASGAARTRPLGLWDAVSIIIGIVVGTAIFRSPTIVFQNVSGPWAAIGVWSLGGVLCLFGAVCYAELATAYPRNGGDYEYLSRAYGRRVGFLFGWAQLTVVLTGSIGAMAYVFADYGAQLWDLGPGAAAGMAAGAILVLSTANLLGAVAGKTLQNVLTGAKVLGLLGVVAAGLVFGRAATLQAAAAAPPAAEPALGLALVFVLYAFGGWSDAVWVAAEVRDVRRTMPRALLLGVAGITAVYLAVVAAYLAVLGFDAARASATPAADVLQRAVGAWGGHAISVLVMVSALGAINGMILTGSRVYATVGEDHRLFARLSRWNRHAAPAAAIAAQAVLAVGLVFAVGTPQGRAALDAAAGAAGLAGLPWEAYLGGFETLVAGTAPVFWGFFLLTGLAVVVLRVRDPGRPRPFRAFLYPASPLVFCAMCAYMLYSSLTYAGALALLGLVPLALGVPLYYAGRA